MKTRHYTPEIKERAVRMLIEALSDYPSTWSAIQAIAPKIGCTPETLRSWHKKHIDQTIPASVQAQSQEQRIPKAKSNVLKSLNARIKSSSKPMRLYVRLLVLKPRRRRAVHPDNGSVY